MNLKELKDKNPGLQLYEIDNVAFAEYGRRIRDVDVTEIIAAGKKVEFPAEGSLYEPSLPAFESMAISEWIQKRGVVSGITGPNYEIKY